MNLWKKFRDIFRKKEIVKGIYIVIHLFDGSFLYVTHDQDVAYKKRKLTKNRGILFISDFVITDNERGIESLKLKRFTWDLIPRHVKNSLDEKLQYNVVWAQVEGYLV